jgi:CHASE2 domain-containing sensor protein/signal transduction histidine kinase
MLKKRLRVQKKQIALREWTVLAILFAASITALLFFNLLSHVDKSIYDRFLQLQSRPARDDIIIVAIDDYSLSELGKWPWPRVRHAQLIRQINAAKPLAIGIDAVFSESENKETDGTDGDLIFAQAIAEKANVVLPMTSHYAGKGLGIALPIAPLAEAAKTLGHIHIELDDDGVVRSVFLKEGMNGLWWPHFSLALHDAGKKIHRNLASEKSFAGAVSLNAKALPANTGAWQRDFQMHIPYYGASGHFTTVPYVAALRGEVPPEFFKNKYVLIGPTALGMADSFPTPVTSNEIPVSGVEINANILASLLDARSITIATKWQSILISLSIVTVALIGFLFLAPRTALLIVLGLIVTSLGLSYAFLKIGLWLPPSASIIVLLAAYPLWSWRRLEAAFSFLGDEFIRLDDEPQLLPEFDPNMSLRDTPASYQAKIEIQDKLERHIHAIQAAARRVRDLRQFITDSLQSLPDATMVTSIDGHVLLTNPAANAYFKSIGIPQVNDALVPYLFANMSHPHTQYAGQGSTFSWWHLLDLEQTTILIKGVEVIDQKGRDLIIKSAPCYSGAKVLIGWIISIIDITDIRQAEHRRDETLHFISHDMRGPQASILALIELQKDPRTIIPHAEFLTRVEKASRTTLGLADNFVQLAQAESNEYRYCEVDFQDILIDATDEMWSLARSKRIKIDTIIPEGDYPARVDRSLMTRVLVNLLSNAVKYSPSDTVVTCTLSFETKNLNDTIICTIQDQGYGIARADQSKLFQRFQRFGQTKQGESVKNDGIGLGMVFVKTVLDRHFAEINFTSVPGEGTCFTIRISAHTF